MGKRRREQNRKWRQVLKGTLESGQIGYYSGVVLHGN